MAQGPQGQTGGQNCPARDLAVLQRKAPCSRPEAAAQTVTVPGRSAGRRSGGRPRPARHWHRLAGNQRQRGRWLVCAYGSPSLAFPALTSSFIPGRRVTRHCADVRHGGARRAVGDLPLDTHVGMLLLTARDHVLAIFLDPACAAEPSGSVRQGAQQESFPERGPRTRTPPRPGRPWIRPRPPRWHPGCPRRSAANARAPPPARPHARRHAAERLPRGTHRPGWELLPGASRSLPRAATPGRRSAGRIRATETAASEAGAARIGGAAARAAAAAPSAASCTAARARARAAYAAAGTPAAATAVAPAGTGASAGARTAARAAPRAVSGSATIGPDGSPRRGDGYRREGDVPRHGRRGILPLPFDARARPACAAAGLRAARRCPPPLTGRVGVVATSVSGALASLVGLANALEDSGTGVSVYSVCSGAALFGFPLGIGMSPDETAELTPSMQPDDYILGDLTVAQLRTPTYSPIWNVEHNRLDYVGSRSHPAMPVGPSARPCPAWPAGWQAAGSGRSLLGTRWWTTTWRSSPPGRGPTHGWLWPMT